MANQKMKILALIPARGGSKRLARKNIMPLNGKPLITWTIEAARACSLIDDVVVSTEDDEILAISEKYGASVPFRRPNELAGDATKTEDVILHAMDYFEKAGQHYDVLVLLQPTSPLRTTTHIIKAIERFSERNADAVVSVMKLDHSLNRVNTLPEDLNMKNFIRREDESQQYYCLNGAIYIARWDYFKMHKSWYSDKTYAYVMERKDSPDIDFFEDYIFAESLMNIYQKELAT